MLKQTLFYGGVAAVATGAGLPILLPQLPSDFQSNSILQPIGLFFINYGNQIAIIGLIMIIVSLFV
jgi:hypothetical protein